MSFDPAFLPIYGLTGSWPKKTDPFCRSEKLRQQLNEGVNCELYLNSVLNDLTITTAPQRTLGYTRSAMNVRINRHLNFHPSITCSSFSFPMLFVFHLLVVSFRGLFFLPLSSDLLFVLPPPPAQIKDPTVLIPASHRHPDIPSSQAASFSPFNLPPIEFKASALASRLKPISQIISLLLFAFCVPFKPGQPDRSSCGDTHDTHYALRILTSFQESKCWYSDP